MVTSVVSLLDVLGCDEVVNGSVVNRAADVGGVVVGHVVITGTVLIFTEQINELA